MAADYQDFLRAKTFILQPSGRDIDPGQINPALFPFQRDLVRWAVRKGRAALEAEQARKKADRKHL